MAKTITLDAVRINAAFQNAVPEFKVKLDAKAAKTLHPEAENMLAQGFLGIPGTGAIDSGVKTACQAWPGINKLLNFCLRLYAWYPGNDKQLLAEAKGWLAMTNAEIVPALCGPQR